MVRSLKRSLFAFFLLSYLGCSEKSKLKENQKFYFSKSQVTSKGSREIYKDMGRSLDHTHIHSDFDGDGIPDFYDKDIDDDGVYNYADRFPFDYERFGKDEDQDGLTDFFDIEVLGIFKYGLDQESANIQLKLFKEKGIQLISGDVFFSKAELKQIYNEFFNHTLRVFNKFNKLSIIYKHPRDYNITKFAHYNESWSTIRLFNSKYLNDNVHNFSNSLVHEVFHSLQKDKVHLYEDFLRLTNWKHAEGGYYYKDSFISDYNLKNNIQEYYEIFNKPNFPSKYAMAGPEEMFAECATAYNILEKIKSKIYPLKKIYSERKYPYLKSFNQSDSHLFFKEKLFDML